MELRIYGMTNAGSYGSSYGGPMTPTRFSAILKPNEKYGYEELHLFLGGGLTTIIGPIEAVQLLHLAEDLRKLANTMER